MAMKKMKIVDVKALEEQLLQETDMDRIDAMTDADIERQVAENPDAARLLTDAESASARVRRMRQRMGLSQDAFTREFLIPPGTLRDWEQGRRAPDAAALAYLRVIEREPEAVRRALGTGAA